MDEFYRAPLSSAEAKATLAALHVLETLLEKSEVVSDIAPEILVSARKRVEAEVPDFVTEQAARLGQSLFSDFREAWRDIEDAGGGETDEPPFPIRRTLRLLQDARDRDAPVEIEYYVRSRDEWTTRRISEVNVVEQNTGVFLQGECGLRGDFRQFRLDHIRSVRVLDDIKDLPDPFTEE